MNTSEILSIYSSRYWILADNLVNNKLNFIQMENDYGKEINQ